MEATGCVVIQASDAEGVAERLGDGGIAGLDRRIRGAGCGGDERSLLHAFGVDKEEELVLNDRSTHSPPNWLRWKGAL